MIIDPRFTQLAEGLTGYSTALKKGERVLIDAFDVPDAIVIALIRATRGRGAYPYVQIHRARVTREMSLGAEEDQFAPHADIELARMQKMDAYIALRGSENIFESSDVPSSKVQLVSRLMKPVLDHRVGKTKWVVLRWPTSAMAQQAGLSTEAFEDFYFRVCTLDYSRLPPGMKAPPAPGEEGARRPDEADGPRPPQGPGHRPPLLDQGHRRPALRRAPQHSRRRG